MTVAVLAVLVTLLAAATLAPLSRQTHWWIRDWDFPRLQVASFALVLLAAELWLLDANDSAAQTLLGITLLCLFYQAWWIFPYTRLYPNEVMACPDADAHVRLRIMTSNVLMTNRNVAGLMALVRRHDPDVLVTLETNLWWQMQMAPLEADYPYRISCPLENLYGMHVYSRLPLENCSTRFLVQEGVPSMHATIVLPSGDRVEAHFLHPAPPSPTENAESSERDAELLLVAREVAGRRTPLIVAGDLNDVAWSETTRLFRKISGLLDPRVGRGMFNTFHAGHWFMRWPLDHLFHSRHFTLSFIRRLPAFGSDHFPVLVELALDAARGACQDGLHADANDRKEAEEKIEAEAATARVGDKLR